ncbi:MAG: wax ester/triacylglycerol synthase domain-containing protein [Dermatophilaceae bacterium]
MRALDSTERIFLRLERPGYPFDIAEILLLEASPEGPLPFEQVRAVFSQRCHRSVPLSRVVARAPLGIGEERWTPAVSLDMDHHVRHRAIPPPGDMAALLRTVIEVSTEPLDRGRPLWQAWYLTGMADGTAALVLRTHHATIDGLGIAQLHHLLFDTQPTEVDVNEQPPPPRGVGGSTQLRRAVFEIPDRLVTEVVVAGRVIGRVRDAVPDVLVRVPTRVLQGAGAKLGAVLFNRPDPEPIRLPELPGYIPSPTGHPPVTPFNKHVDNPRKALAVISLPLEQVKQVRRAFPQVTVNDILLALVTGSLRDYLAARDELPPGPIRTTSPAHIPASDDNPDAGNHFTTIWMDLPVHLPDPAERLAAVSASATAAKQSLRESQASWDALADLGDLLLPGVVAAAMAFAGTRAFGVLPPTQNLTTSTVIGSRELRYLATRKITHMYARTIVCPPVNLFMCSYTYEGIIDFSVTTIEQLCPDPEALAVGLRTELDRLLTLAPPRGADQPRPRKSARRHDGAGTTAAPQTRRG